VLCVLPAVCWVLCVSCVCTGVHLLSVFSTVLRVFCVFSFCTIVVRRSCLSPFVNFDENSLNF